MTDQTPFQAMFSKRSAFERGSTPFSEAVASARNQKKIKHDLTVSNPTRVNLPYPEDLLQALASPAGLHYSPAPFGMEATRKLVAEHLSRPGRTVDWHRVILTASTSEAYSWLFKLLCDEGDTVLAPSPSYPLFEHLARLDGVTLENYSLRYDGAWYIDEPPRNTNARAVLAVHPNNPTGHALHQSDLKILESLNIPIICDEVFAPYPLPSKGALSDRLDTLLDAETTSLCFVLGGLSKDLALPQMKLGWIVVHGPDDLVEEALARLELCADTYLSVATPIQLALPQLFERGEAVRDALKSRICKHLKYLQETLADTAATVLGLEGGWTAVIELPRIWSEDRYVMELLEAGVLVQPGWLYDFEREAYVVVSLIVEDKTFESGITILREIINRATLD